MNRVRYLATMIFERNPSRFTSDFNGNKTTLGEMCTIQSKQMRNKIAGCITILSKQADSSEDEQLASEAVTSESNTSTPENVKTDEPPSDSPK